VTVPVAPEPGLTGSPVEPYPRPAGSVTPRKLLHGLVWAYRHQAGRLPVPEFAFMRPYLRPDDLGIDVGAHGGSWTRVLSRALPLGHVYAFEALPYYADVLALTCRLCGWRNVSVVAAAVVDAPRTVRLVHRGSDGHPLTGRTHLLGSGDGGAPSVAVQGITLDSFMATMTSGRVGLIKCDVEGFELPVLRGAAQMIRTHQPLIWCEVWTEYTQRYGYHPRDLFAFLAESNYRTYTIGPDGGWMGTDAQSYSGAGDVLAAPVGLALPRPAS